MNYFHIGKPAVLMSFSSLILIYLQSSGVAHFIFIIAARLCVHVDAMSSIFFFRASFASSELRLVMCSFMQT